MHPVAVQVAADADRPVIRSLLAEARLPVADIDQASDLTFWIVRSATGKTLAAIGLERRGTVALLRSLIVVPEQRQLGLRRALVSAVERYAAGAEIEQLVLLTETAEPFFRRLGYSVIDRDEAPATVTSTAEFRTLCPATAVCMTKLL
jgi:N-acetylglutamate synthase-like GNAT family acetyltransferase